MKGGSQRLILQKAFETVGNGATERNIGKNSFEETRRIGDASF
jgi:hypothetical protein